jgi:hypothetical protein
MASPLVLKCPVCNASFRGSITCSRCGTDLRAVMLIAARAWSARQRCGEELSSGNLEAAAKWADEARKLHRVVSSVHEPT